MNLDILPKIVVILGPTASGKTNLAIKIAKFLSNPSRMNSNKSRIKNGVFENNSRERVREAFERYNGAEIISADSRQIYRGMDIGTAKPIRDLSNPSRINSNESRITNSIFEKNSRSFDFYSRGVKHYLIDIKNPNQNYTVAQYKKDAIMAIKKVLTKNKLPILIGGTGLYIKAVVDNLEIPEVKPNPRLRQKLEKELKAKGLNHLYEKLISLDPEAAYIIDRYNPRRVIRALEITIQTKKPFSTQRKQGKKLFDALKIGIDVPSENLKEKIEKRVDQMIKDGLIKEVKSLIKKYPPKFEKNSRNRIREGFERQYNPVFDAIGYREIINYLQAKISLPEAIDEIKKNTWHYAKRQMTWFKKDKEIIWLANPEKAFAICRDFLCP